jgi:hypothetical protein
MAFLIVWRDFSRKRSRTWVILSSISEYPSHHSQSVVAPIPALTQARLIGIPSASASQSRSIAFSLYLMGLASDPFSSLVVTCLVLFVLTLPAFVMFGAHLGRFLRFADSLYLAVLDGTLDKRLWRGYERTLADTVAYPGFQAWWATRKHWHTDEFCALIDRHIQTAKPKIYEDYS